MILFRPHHFLCAFCFQGRGYSAPFLANFSAIIDYLTRYPKEPAIRITSDTDSICAPCPHRRGQLCTSQTKIEKLDKAHTKAMGFSSELPRLSWSEAKDMITKRLTMQKFYDICSGCEWQAAGICESVLKQSL